MVDLEKLRCRSITHTDTDTNTVVALAQSENQGFDGLVSWGWGQAN